HLRDSNVAPLRSTGFRLQVLDFKQVTHGVRLVDKCGSSRNHKVRLAVLLDPLSRGPTTLALLEDHLVPAHGQNGFVEFGHFASFSGHTVPNQRALEPIV
ncbi:uncharacterized protein METZ01_LOCUS490484, partial [marine metagenome]